MSSTRTYVMATLAHCQLGLGVREASGPPGCHGSVGGECRPVAMWTWECCYRSAASRIRRWEAACWRRLASEKRPILPGEKVVDVVVDSGAVASVAPKGLFPGALESSIMSRAGRTYRAANGSPIRNFGQVRVPFVSAEGHKCSFPFQVAEVEHALLSVGHLAEAGNRVELGAKGGRIVNIATGRAMALTRRGGVYVLRLRVSGFPRPGATKQ